MFHLVGCASGGDIQRQDGEAEHVALGAVQLDLSE